MLQVACKWPLDLVPLRIPAQEGKDPDKPGALQGD